MSRSETSLGIEPQPRDIALLRGLFESRVMTLAHAAALYFDEKPEAAKKRVQKLKAAHLIGERPRWASDPSILYLTKAAFTLLVQGGHLHDYPRITWEKLEGRVQVSALTLRHELEVMDCKAAMVTAIRKLPTLSLAEFSTWPLLNQFNAFHPATGEKKTVKPDGFIRLHQADSEGAIDEHQFFLELDRSTETQGILATKIACYLDYYTRGGFAMKHGHAASEYREFPFRVLVVCKSAERRNNHAERLLLANPPIKTFALLTTFVELIAAAFSTIWVQPADYLLTTRGTIFDPLKIHQTNGYRRNSAKEQLLERVEKRSIFGEHPGAAG